MKCFIPVSCLAGDILQVLLQVGSFKKKKQQFFSGGDEKWVIYNLIISYLGASLSWDSYILIEYKTSLFES